MQTNTKPSMKIRRQNLRNNMTKEEQILWSHLRSKQLGVKFRRQHSIGNYVVDFYCHEYKLVIELDGFHHYTEDGLEYDTIREEYMKCSEINTIRFKNIEILEDIENVLLRIKEVLSPSFV